MSNDRGMRNQYANRVKMDGNHEDPPVKYTPSKVPHHGGTPVEMLRDLADFLDTLDDASSKFTAPDGRTMDDILRGDEPNRREMQADVRWLADQLERGLG